MEHELWFRVKHRYDENGVSLPVVLSLGRHSLRATARVDTGADVCVFKREHGEELKLDIESGQPLQITTATGSFLTYGHSVTVEALGLPIDAMVYFTFTYGFPRNVLGRRGWMEQLRLGLTHYERLFYAARYDDLRET